MKFPVSISPSESFFTKRRLGWAGLAAVGGCGAACSVSMLAVVAGSGATAAAVAGIFGGGRELIFGGLAFFATIGVMAVRARRRAKPTTSTPELPIVCDATIFAEEERTEHLEQTKDLLLRRPVRVQTLENGLEFHYTASDDLFQSLATWATFEHRCCAWARFSLEMDPFPLGGTGAVRLRMSGGPKGNTLLLDSLKQLEKDGPMVREFLRGASKLTPESLSGRPGSCC